MNGATRNEYITEMKLQDGMKVLLSILIFVFHLFHCVLFL